MEPGRCGVRDNLEDCLEKLGVALRLVVEAQGAAHASYRRGEPVAARRERVLQLCADIEDAANNLPGYLSQTDGGFGG